MLTLSSPAQRYGIICNEWCILMPTDLDPFVPQIINSKEKQIKYKKAATFPQICI